MSMKDTTEVYAQTEYAQTEYDNDIRVLTTYSELLLEEADAIEEAVEKEKDVSKANKAVENSCNAVNRFTESLYSDTSVSDDTLMFKLRNLITAVNNNIRDKVWAFKATQKAHKLRDIANKLTASRIAEYKTNQTCNNGNCQLALTCVSVSSNNE